jgi:NADH-quinone oxidoreductase subunit L
VLPALQENVLRDEVLSWLPFWVLLLPLLGFTVLALFGDQIKRQEQATRAAGGGGLLAHGRLFSGLIACTMVFGSFVASAFSLWRLGRLLPAEGLRSFQSVLGPSPAEAIPWLSVGNVQIPFSLLLDPLSAVMILAVTGISFLIHVYSLGYMHDDEDEIRYFSHLNLFVFFMLVLVLGGSLPLMFVGWEGVGLCSYLLIGFWYKKQSASDAGKKAFIVNRIGDAGLILGMIVAFHAFGTLSLDEIARGIGAKPGDALGEFGVITAVALLLFVGACGKSAQIPLHIWLPDAMEGPTPVSALIHAATMVTAGVYMVARLAPLYAKSETAMLVVAVVGCATAFMAATIALVQTDIKRVLAYSTVSQLGYMFLACGVGAFGVAIFHLVTHAFFKALLFLGSGSVIHAMSGEQDMRKMGGLRRKVPWTFWTFVVATLAIAGIPPLAGYYSKDAILAGALADGKTALFAIGLFTALLTSFYMGRLLILTFFGSFRGGEEAERHVHESPWTMLFPLVILAAGSATVGYLGERAWSLTAYLEPAFRLEAHEAHHAAWLPYLATLAAALGLVAAWYAYVTFKELPSHVGAALRPLQRALEAKWGFDLLFNWIAGRVVVDGSREVLWKALDANVIDGAVNGAGSVVDAASRQVRLVQTGLVRGYALVILGGAVALLAYLLWL